MAPRKLLRRGSSLRVVVGGTNTSSPNANRGAYIFELKGEGINSADTCIEIGNKENHAPGTLLIIFTGQALNPTSASPGKRKHDMKSCEPEVEMEVFLGADTDFTTFLHESPDALSTSTRFSPNLNSAGTLSRSSPPLERRFPQTPNTALEIPHVVTSGNASLSPVFFDLQVGEEEDNALVVPLSPFEVVRRLRFLTEGTNGAPPLKNETGGPLMPLPQSPLQIIPVSAVSSRFYMEVHQVMGELVAISTQCTTLVDVHGKDVAGSRNAMAISRGMLVELEAKVDGIRSLRELGFDLSCLGEEGDELLNSPWTAFEKECRRSDEDSG